MIPHDLSRRQLLLSGVASILAAGDARAAESTVRFRLVETAGLRRFGFPIHTVLPGVRSGGHFRLSQSGKAVPAQFRSIENADGERAVALDFNASLDPLATQSYDVTFGDDVRPDPEPKVGLNVEELESVFRVSGSGMTYDVPRDLVGFLKRAGGDRKEYLQSGSRGFWIRIAEPERGAEEQRGAPLRGVVSRAGPLTVGLRFTGTWPLDGNRKAKVVVDLTFPSSKSWVELDWTIDDREHGRVITMDLDLDLAIEGTPTLVDFGAQGTVYTTISGTDRAWMNGNSPADWQVYKSAAPSPILLAKSRAKSGYPSVQKAEGWAHAMDGTRCTAIAIADFGRATSDRLEISANGRVRLVRLFFTNSSALKTMKAWFHFVGMPVQVGALTSPQSMLAPPKVEWL
jgi:hypothetical protein